MASASPREQQQQAVKVVASSCPTSPLQSGNNSSKPDRTADFAAVRNLAESYGVALLPLEMGFTPLRTQRPKSAAAARLSTADSTTDHPNTPEVGENAAAAAAGRGLDQAYSASSTTGQHDTNELSSARLLSPSKAGAAPQPLQAAGGSGEAVSCFPIDVEEGSELNTESPSGMADFADAGDGEGLYLYEDQLPMEERVTLLEEERDLLVDKLLATTEALHASEARNRQSEASQGQVHALLEQLQELLRRAEVERDRAKMQLKRHRASSNSQFVFPPVVLGSHPLSQGGIEALQSGPFALGSLGGAASSGGHDGLEAGLAARPRSKKYKVSRGGRAAGAGAGAAAAPAGEDAGAGSESAAASEEDGAAAAGAGSADGSSTAASAAVPAAEAPAAGQAQERGGDSSVAAEGPWGSRRGSNASSCDSSDAVSPSVSPEPVVTLTPSTDEARPPVSSVVRGFEALLHRHRGGKGSPAGSSAGGQRSRELTLSARSSGSGGSRSASPMASRGGAGNPAALTIAAAPAGDEDAVEAVLTAGEGLPAEAAAAAALASPAGTADGSEQQGLSPSASEVFRRTYADAAVAGAEAERSRRSTAGIRPRVPLGAGSSSSATSTPTAAALCNAASVGSYMLDSSVFSEEEELLASAGGAAPLPACREGTPSSGQGVYNPSRYTPARGVEPGCTGGAVGEWQSAGKRGSGSSSSLSSSPTVTPTAQQQQAGGRSSPGSAFGSMISVTADSPAGSVTQSCPGAAAPSPVGAYSSSGGSNGAGSTKGKARSASRLGMLQSPTATAPVDLSPRPVAATNSKQQQQQQAQKRRRAQQQGSGSGVSKSSSSSTSSGGARRQSPRQSVDATAEVGVTAAGAAAQAHKSAGPRAAATRGKQGAKKATPVTQQPPAACTASNGSATTSSNSNGSMLLVAVVLLLSVVAVAVYFWSQYRLAAMQAQVQQLQKQLSQRSVECPSGLGGDGFDG